MSFNWPEFFSQFSSGLLILVMGGLGAAVLQMTFVLRGLPERLKKLDERAQASEDRHEVHDTILSQHLGTVIRSDMIALGKMDYPSKKWKGLRDET